MRTVLVDPSRTVLKVVTRLLEQGGHEVRPFEDGNKALDYVRGDREVRSLITSAELPSLSGIGLCGEVRRLAGSSRPIYIILMSCSSDAVMGGRTAGETSDR
jgi:two-component system, cell cycle response regulator